MLASLSVGLYGANRQRQIAKRRFLEVRQLANTFIELDRGLRGLDGATTARNRIISDSLAYLAGLGKEAQGDRDLNLEIGWAYLQVARIQGVPVESHLGEFREAEENLRNAQASVEVARAGDPASRRAQLLLAEIAHDSMILAILQDRRQEALSQAARMRAQLDLLTSRGELNPAEVRDVAILSSSRAFALEYRTSSSRSVAGSDRRPGEFMTAWSYSTPGELGSGLRASRLSDVMGIVPIAHWQPFSLAVRDDGTVWTWGRTVSGPTDGPIAHPFPVQVPALDRVVAVAGGGRQALALKADGTVWAWGYNSNGQAGDGKGLPGDGHARITAAPVEVSGLSGIIAIAGGGAHNLAVKADGTVWTWGFNQYGQLGNGTNADSYAPVQVPGLVNAIAAAGGEHYSLALKSDGTVWAWGHNHEGELGNGTNTDSNLPVWVTGLNGVVAIAPTSGAKHSLALKSDGTVWAWGYNASGQLGNGGNTDSNVAIQVPGVRGAIAIAAGGAHSVAILAAPAGQGR